MATKREHAVAVLDALESKVRLKSKTVLAAIIAAAFLLAVAYFTMWQYAVGGALLLAVLLQMTHERLTIAADAMIETNLQRLGWDLEALDDDASMAKLREFAKKNEG